MKEIILGCFIVFTHLFTTGIAEAASVVGVFPTTGGLNDTIEICVEDLATLVKPETPEKAKWYCQLGVGLSESEHETYHIASTKLYE